LTLLLPSFEFILVFFTFRIGVIIIRMALWALMSFPDGGGAAASYLPVLSAAYIFSGADVKKGLLIPPDFIKPGEIIDAARSVGWNGSFIETVSDKNEDNLNG
jgi:hypothetical protein